MKERSYGAIIDNIFEKLGDIEAEVLKGYLDNTILLSQITSDFVINNKEDRAKHQSYLINNLLYYMTEYKRLIMAVSENNIDAEDVPFGVSDVLLLIIHLGIELLGTSQSSKRTTSALLSLSSDERKIDMDEFFEFFESMKSKPKENEDEDEKAILDEIFDSLSHEQGLFLKKKMDNSISLDSFERLSASINSIDLARINLFNSIEGVQIFEPTMMGNHPTRSETGGTVNSFSANSVIINLLLLLKVKDVRTLKETLENVCHSLPEIIREAEYCE